MSIQFKKAAHEDLPQIVEIYNQIIPSRLATADLDPVTVEQREEWFASFTPTHPLWKIVNSEGQMIGWVGLEPFYGRPAYEHTSEIAIYIDQDARHQGIGRQAIEFVISQLPQLGISAIVAYIFGHNIPSLKLFKEFEFEEWGKLPQVAELDGIQRDLVILGRRFDLSTEK
ncbi:N-acetyltransferase [Limosilactobacillus sp. Sa3CUN2]|uniref:N-acetyltransferase n=1 Tax=Limosilactobacillus avistercoris TaxID=2762243 RepID=A0ABR8PB52_9LACO|nr:GNAT family N-acetyltransferase [Limosilactobacillus avistercoris]MBD7894524.1 N-acetyltransferase [Limosilactobacillus avistercoris]